MSLFSLLTRILLFTSVFVIDVKVKASEAAHGAHQEAHKKEEPSEKAASHEEKKSEKKSAEVKPREMLGSELPENCWTDEKLVCAVKSSASRFEELTLGESQLVLEADSLIVRLSATELRLVKGGVWVKAKNAVQVKTEFGLFRSSNGEFEALRSDDRVVVTAVSGVVGLVPRGGQESLIVPPAMENWLGKMDAKGVATMGIPTPVQLEAYLKKRAKIFRGDKEEFEAQAKEFYPRWQAATKSSAAIHQALFDRKVASLQEDYDRKESARQKVESRNRELRDLFKRKLAE